MQETGLGILAMCIMAVELVATIALPLVIIVALIRWLFS